MNVTQRCTYAGIGSRATPDDILQQMEDIAKHMCNCGWTLRSGGAAGADTAFERGADNKCGRKEIFLPTGYIPQEAFEIAENHHPSWGRLKPYVRQLHARNVQQILGADLELPTTIVICWTPDGAEKTTTPKTGGTGQAIRIANTHNIPVYNLANEGRLEQVKDICDHQLMQYSDLF